jgi:cytochrome c553
MAGLARLTLTVLAISGCGPVAAPPPPSGELIAFGGGPGGAADACFSCHGFAGEGDAGAPRLAGLGHAYLAKQLADYATARRPHPAMTPIARRLSDADARAAARYYAALPAPPRIAPPPPRLSLYHARVAAPSCADCHGARGEGKGPAIPAIAGQPAPYLEEQLRLWRRGVRRNDPGHVMTSAARRLSDEEIAALADYLARRP